MYAFICKNLIVNEFIVLHDLNVTEVSLYDEKQMSQTSKFIIESYNMGQAIWGLKAKLNLLKRNNLENKRWLWFYAIFSKNFVAMFIIPKIFMKFFSIKSVYWFPKKIHIFV